MDYYVKEDKDMQRRLDLLSKPKISLAVIDRVMEGQMSSDPVLVINSMDVPTLHVEVACLATGREVGYLTKNYEEVIYVIDGKGVVYQREGEREQKYEFGPGDSIFVPANVPSKLLNGSDRPLKFVRARGISLNPCTVADVKGPWPESSGFYCLPSLAEKEDVRGRKRLVRAAEDTFISGAGLLAADARIQRNERHVQYRSCGSRTICSSVREFKPGEEGRAHWQNFEEIIYVAKGQIIEYEGPRESAIELHAEEGDLLYQPNQVRHAHAAPAGAKIALFWGVFTIPWCTDVMLDGVHGVYKEDDILFHNLP